MKSRLPIKVFAVDVHPIRFGFAVFAGPDELLDWGIKSFRHGVNAVKVPMPEKMALLLDRYKPEMIVMNTSDSAALRNHVRAIAALARRRSITVCRISRRSVRKAFPENNQNKYAIATEIARLYPELSPHLSPKRKFFQAERYSMGIFDAAALGIAYFRQETSEKGITSNRALSALPR